MSHTPMPRTRSLRLGVLAAAGALVLAACSPSAEEDVMESDDAMSEDAMSPTPSHDAMDDGATEDEAMDDDAMEDEGMVDVPAELSFTATTVAGTPIDGADLAGQDAIFWFWAAWCPNCRAEAPEVAAALDGLPDDVEFYGVAGRDTVDASQAFIDSHGLDAMDHVFDEDGSIWAGFGVTYQPAFALVNDDGTIEIVSGALGTDGIIEAAEELAAS